MHREPDNILSPTSANGSAIPCFTVVPADMGLPPQTLPIPHLRDRSTASSRPQTPVRGLLPSRPPGERGEAHPRRTLISKRLNTNALKVSS
jgi:hypothetical protein